MKKNQDPAEVVNDEDPTGAEVEHDPGFEMAAGPIVHAEDLTEDAATDDDAGTDPAAESDADAPDDAPEARAVRYVRLGELVLDYKHWRNPRTVTGLDSESISRLAESIKARTVETASDDGGNPVTYAGINDPLLVVQIAVNGGVTNLVLDGQRRHRAATEALHEDAMIPVIDREPEPVGEWSAGLAAKYLTEVLDMVGTREGLSGYEISESAERLRAMTNPDTKSEYTMEQIGAAVGRSASWVSKILKARSSATPRVMLSWKSGEITEEQFKAVTSERNPEAQDATQEAVSAAVRSGDKAGARALAKEQKERVKKAAKAAHEEKAEKAKPAKKKAKKKGEATQTEMPSPPPRKPPPFAVIEDLVTTADKRPPTHDYVKGIIDGARWATGLLDSAQFAKAWTVYMNLVAGAGAKPEPVAAKPKKKR